MPTPTPFLWFNDNADEAVDFYLSVFPNSRRTSSSDKPSNTPGGGEGPMVVAFELDGQAFMALNGGPQFEFTPAISFVVSCQDQSEIDYYWDRLVDGGSPVQCGWLVDRFGLSWQIVPADLENLMSGGPERSERVMAAVLSMVKLDIAALEAAARG